MLQVFSNSDDLLFFSGAGNTVDSRRGPYELFRGGDSPAARDRSGGQRGGGAAAEAAGAEAGGRLV